MEIKQVTEFRYEIKYAGCLFVVNTTDLDKAIKAVKTYVLQKSLKERREEIANTSTKRSG